MILSEEQKVMIYQDYQKKVLGYINGKVCNLHLAEDICSTVFLKVYEKLDTFDDSKASISTWIFTITRNTLTDYYRTRKVHEEIPETLAEDSSVEEEVCNAQMQDKLAAALETLNERERDILILHYYSKKKLKDIADIMGISYSYVKLLHTKALEAMKNYFEK